MISGWMRRQDCKMLLTWCLNICTWKLCDVNTNDDKWKLDLFHNMLMNNIVQRIIVILPPSMENDNDVFLCP